MTALHGGKIILQRGRTAIDLRPQKPKVASNNNQELPFQCNVCGTFCKFAGVNSLNRETPSCSFCASNVRFRSLVLGLSESLFGSALTIPEFPVRKDIRGLGLSDWEPLAKGLCDHFDYISTYYHQEPHLDITDVPLNKHAQYDFVISSDVFEHVSPPVQRAFNGCSLLLKPKGLLLLTVPYHLGNETDEHFPELYDWTIGNLDGLPILINRTEDGREQVYQNLVFHGGPGQTIEMRVFGRMAIVNHLEAAGFTQIRFLDHSVPTFGVCWQEPHSVLITARKTY